MATSKAGGKKRNIRRDQTVVLFIPQSIISIKGLFGLLSDVCSNAICFSEGYFLHHSLVFIMCIVNGETGRQICAQVCVCAVHGLYVKVFHYALLSHASDGRCMSSLLDH